MACTGMHKVLVIFIMATSANAPRNAYAVWQLAVSACMPIWVGVGRIFYTVPQNSGFSAAAHPTYRQKARLHSAGLLLTTAMICESTCELLHNGC